jgi:hypothetical protein
MTTPRRKGSVDGRIYDFAFTGEQGYPRSVVDSIVDMAATAGQVDASTTQRQLVSANGTPADAGVWRLAHTDAITWRNQANSDNLPLTRPAASDALTFRGIFLRGAPAASLVSLRVEGAAAGQSIASAAYPAGLTTLTLSREVIDTANMSAGATFTVPNTGVYLIQGQVNLLGSAGTLFADAIFINGVEKVTEYRNLSGTNTLVQRAPLTTCLLLTAGDVVTYRAVQTSNGAVASQVDTGSTFITVLQLWGDHTP